MMPDILTIRSIRQRLAMVEAAARLVGLGLNRGRAGNISLRWEDGFLITPSGMAPQGLHPEDIVEMSMDGTAHGTRAPSSEWRFHRDIYARFPQVGAVVHAHPPFCVALAALRMPIPAYHYMVATAGGRDIRCADYATFGTQELSERALAALEGRKACLLANHGMIATGPGLDQAMDLAVEVEELAEGYWRALQLGKPVILDDEEMDRVIAKFAGYGQPGRSEPADR